MPIRSFSRAHVRIEDVAAVFAQMRGDAIGAGSDCDFGSLDRIGMPAAACVAHGGDVIDVHAESDREDSHISRKVQSRIWYSAASPDYPFTRSAAATTFFARNCEMIEVRCLRL